MGKFKYEVYDYSKAGIDKKKIFFRKELNFYELEAIKRIAKTTDGAIEILHEEFKKVFFEKYPNYQHDPNIDWACEIITPGKRYVFK